jgi:hypothetical protein
MKILNLDEIVDSSDPKEVVTEVLQSGEFNPTREMGSVLPYTRRVSPNQIVPEEYQHKLMEIDFTLSQCFWLIGDITVELISSVNRERSKELGKLISNTDIFESVGLFCHRTGRSVRRYYECARFFPPVIRQKYDVPFTIYTVARWIDNWELFLTMAFENPIWGAEKVRAEYYKLLNQEVPKRPESLKSGSAESAIPDSSSAVALPEPKYKEVLLSKLDHSVDSLRAVLDRIQLPTEIRIRIGNVILEISDILLTIRREM